MFSLVILLNSLQTQSVNGVLVKSVLKICSKFTGEHPCGSVNSIKLRYNFIEITLSHGCSHVNVLHIFRKLVRKNTKGMLLSFAQLLLVCNHLR